MENNLLLIDKERKNINNLQSINKEGKYIII